MRSENSGRVRTLFSHLRLMHEQEILEIPLKNFAYIDSAAAVADNNSVGIRGTLHYLIS